MCIAFQFHISKAENVNGKQINFYYILLLNWKIFSIFSFSGLLVFENEAAPAPKPHYRIETAEILNVGQGNCRHSLCDDRITDNDRPHRFGSIFLFECEKKGVAKRCFKCKHCPKGGLIKLNHGKTPVCEIKV